MAAQEITNQDIFDLIHGVEKNVRQELIDQIQNVENNLRQDLSNLIKDGLEDAKVELRYEIHQTERRLTQRIDGLEARIEQVQQTMIEDGDAFRSIYVNHDNRILSLEKWRTVHSPV